MNENLQAMDEYDSPVTAQTHLEVLRRLSNEQRFELGAELFDLSLRILADGIRNEHPEYLDDQVKDEVRRRLLGEELAELVYGPRRF